MDHSFFVKAGELDLRFAYPKGKRRLAFKTFGGSPALWREQGRAKFADLIGYTEPAAGAVSRLREIVQDGVVMQALVMQVTPELSMPAYLLRPVNGVTCGTVMAIHGHGEVEPCLGLHDDYHHQFALRLAQAGYRVLCPELRGFGALKDLAVQADGKRLDYWNWGGAMAYTLVTDGFLYGHTLLGDTVMDVLRWEQWLAQEYALESLDVAGISYGGDLALAYPVFSDRVRRIFASGTLGSFDVIFSKCYNAPAHCIPGVLAWMDRADIAGLNAPRPLALHYGELDVPGDDNYSASYNETVSQSLLDLRAIYRAFGAEDAVELIVSTGRKHEMDLEALITFISKI